MSEHESAPLPADAFGTHDHLSGEGVFYRSAHALRLKLHKAAERFNHAGAPEIFPLQRRRGQRLYFLAMPYILLPDMRVRINVYPYPTPGDQGALGEVAGSDWGGRKPEGVGSAQGWYYPEDRTLVLWEVDLHQRHRQPHPVADPNQTAVWQGVEWVRLAHCPDAQLLATPVDDPNYW
jgi:hypothetical protein